MAKLDGRVERGLATRERILDSAIDLIASGGVGAATQRSVAGAAGVSLANVTYHFATAKELVVAAMRRAAGLATTRLALDGERVLSGEVSLEDSTIEYIEAHRSGAYPAGIVALELSMAAVRDPSLREADEANIEALGALFEPYVDNPLRAQAAANAFTGLLLLELGSTRPSGSEGTRAVVRELIDVFDLEAGLERNQRAQRIGGEDG